MTVFAPSNPPQLLNVQEFASAVRLKPATVRRHLATGDIRGVRIGSGPKAVWRIPRAELDRLSGEEQV